MYNIKVVNIIMKFFKGRLVSSSTPGSVNVIGQEGWFKQECVEEFTRPKSSSSTLGNSKSNGGSLLSSDLVGGDSVVVKRKTLLDLIAHADFSNVPRTVVLQRGKKGFGFVLRGAKSMLDLIHRVNETI